MQRIKTIRIQNFKAFKEAISLDLDGKSTLIYGNNGSGKSSLFWALYTFLQSSFKTKEEVEKYFRHFDKDDKKTHESLRNVYAEPNEVSEIKLSVQDMENGREVIYTISKDTANTNLSTDTTISEANLASDFINYKLLYNFYNNTHKHEINLWNVFERDFFPYFIEGKKSYRVLIDGLKTQIPRNRTGNLYPKNSSQVKEFEETLSGFNTKIQGFLDKIANNANETLKRDFYDNKDFVKVHLEFIKKINYDLLIDKNKELDSKNLHIKLWIELFDEPNNRWVENYRPHSFLNEAQLTRIAIAIRIGALLTRITSSDLRLLVLDDMLISLDMSNRMQVVDMLLNKANKPELQFFEGFQKIILTHDKAFFNLIKRDTSPLHWKYYELDRKEMSNESPKITPTKEYIEKALDYLNNRDFDGCALELRKELEALLKRKLSETTQLNDKQHQELSDMLKSVKTKLESDSQTHLKRFLKQGHDATLIAKLNTDFQNDTTLTPEQKGKLRSFQITMIDAFKQCNENKEDIDELLGTIKKHIDFVLNRAAHNTTLPAFENELREAYLAVSKLKKYFETQLK